MSDLVSWLRAALDEIETDARFYLASGADNGPGMEWAQLALAEVDAKRRLLELHSSPDPSCDECGYITPCATVRLLALPFADRPGYRDEWAPTSASA